MPARRGPRPKTHNARKRTRRPPDAPYPYARKAALPEFRPLTAEFETSAQTLAQCPPQDGREVAFAGRSNAGKSSALNRLTGRKSLARTGRTPGRTQLLNFFRITLPEAEDLPPARLVDLPGYGYAKTNHATRDAWREHVEHYLAARQSLVGVVLLMDIRRPFQEFDETLLEWAGQSGLPLLVLLNKADKLSTSAAAGVLRSATDRLAPLPNVSPMLFSAMRGAGAQQCGAILRDWLNLPEPEEAEGSAAAGDPQE